MLQSSVGLLTPACALALAFGYLLGSIPFGVILTRLAGLGDIRTVGSGNIGATNVLRTGRRGLAAATLIGDALKGAAAVIIARRYGDDLALVAGLGAFLGHLFPVWLAFKGGKGVATYIGILIAVSWLAALIFGAIWLGVAAITRYSSLAGLVASTACPAALWMLGLHRPALLFVVLTAVLWWRHRENIARLAAGTESKIGRSSQPAAES